MILIILPLQIYIFYTNVQVLLPAHPYSWKATHGPSLSQITKVPTNGKLKFDRWISPAFSVLIFIFFGLGQDAASMYNNFFNVVGLKGFSVSFSSWKSTSVSSSSSGDNNKGDHWYDPLRSKNFSWLGSRRAYVSAFLFDVMPSSTDRVIEAKGPLSHLPGRRMQIFSCQADLTGRMRVEALR
jgi:pheromone a factor receptor